MNRWLERYERGHGAQVWTEMTSLGPDLRTDPEDLASATVVARETMRRARENVERLVELLPAHGYEFTDDPFVAATPEAGAQLDQVEAESAFYPWR